MASSAIQGSQPLSRYGESELLRNLTLGIARDVLHERRWGSTDLSRLNGHGVATAPGNVTYPTRNFATLGMLLA
jgi:hypothetical protein